MARFLSNYGMRGVVFVGGTIITIIFVLPLVSGRSLQFALDTAARYPYAAPLVIIGLRFVGVVVAPLPGSPIMLASIAILPWWQAWLYNFLGSISGSVSAFYIARRFREPVVARFAPLQEVNRWQEKISQRKQFWTFAGLRLITPIAFDFVNYAAGLTKMRFRAYLFATLLVDVPTGFLFFYLGGIAIRYGIYFFLAAGVVLVVVGAVVKLKYRVDTAAKQES